MLVPFWLCKRSIHNIYKIRDKVWDKMWLWIGFGEQQIRAFLLIGQLFGDGPKRGQA